MSLDVYLMEDAATFAASAEELEKMGIASAAARLRKSADSPEELYSANITHNLGRMADAAGIYMPLWRPDECGVTHARQLVEPLREGLRLLESDPARFEKFNAANGWGLYEHFVPFVRSYLAACEENPDAVVEVSR